METIRELHRRACEIFDLSPKQVSIWDYFSHQKHALMNDMEQMLDNANIQMDQDRQYKSNRVCPACNKVSITFDLFMYISLPLQSATTRSMAVTVFTCNGSALPAAYTVTVPKQRSCRD
ncbi:hypothetical protein ACS0TY_002933 [Phlomoides rotata]